MKRVLLIVALSFPTILYSQGDFRPGYVVTNSGDTLFGVVSYRESAKAYVTCDFRKSRRGVTTSYSPADVKAYGIADGRFYASGDLPLAAGTKKVFLQVLAKGEVSLYKFEDTFWVEKSGDLQALINSPGEVIIGGERYYKSLNEHISALSILLSDCDDVKPIVQKVQLYERPLTRLIDRYNACKGSVANAMKSEKRWIKPMVGAVAGINVSKVKFAVGNEIDYGHLTGSTDVAGSPTVGILLTLFSPRISERFSLITSLSYAPVRYTKNIELERNLGVDKNYTTINLQQLKLPVGLRYTFTGMKLAPFVNIGVAGTMHLSSKSKWYQEISRPGRTELHEGEALPIDETQFGFWAGLGVTSVINSKWDISFEIRGERTDGIVPLFNPLRFDHVLDSKVFNLQFTVELRRR